ncbi:low-density lipoprotein receptor-related protein 6-like [Clavelina lepadiformis]|uniref:low-density lipoprotein receptor-related protein 6-like n=1 Tax=Clavelina lepadiformis TaxID=159417 RepID=UPI004041DFA7
MLRLCILFVILASTGYSQSFIGDSPQILLANHGNVQLIPIGQANRTNVVASGLTQAIACDFIYEDKLIFWMEDAMDYGKGKIQYVNMSSPKHKKMNVLRSGMAKPDGLTCDWIGKKIYWTDAETNRIEVSELDGNSRKVLIWDNLDQPRAIAVDPNRAFMYWTDWGESPKIERAGMDGTHRQVLVNKNIYWPNGITLDYDEEKVYWVEANYHFIHRMNMDGSSREEVITSERIRLGFDPLRNPDMFLTTTSPATNDPDPDNHDEEKGGSKLLGALQHPFAITLYKDFIYWSDWATNSIHSMLKNGSGLPNLVKGKNISPMDLQIYSAGRQRPGRNPCHPNNGGCSHLCLLSPDPPFYRCACPTGVQIMPDNMTCKNGPNEILLLARRADLRVISLDTDDHTDVLVPVSNIKHAIAVEYDPVEEYVYWSDDGTKAIMRAHLNGTGYQAIITDSVEQCDGMAIDWIARNLYWTDTGRNFIAVSRLNGTSRKVLIESGLDQPRAIVLDPIAGHMYWTDWGKQHPKIERANLDGSDRLVFVSTALEWPNGLAIDHNKSVLYWADACEDRIEMIYLNGTGRKILLSMKNTHVFGLSLLGDYLYWTDWQRRRVERMKIGGRRPRKTLIDQLPDVMGVKATSKKVLPGSNQCAINNGGCSHLCLYSPGREMCHCPNGMELAPDTTQCIIPEAFLLFSFTNTDGIRKFSLDTAHGDDLIPFNHKVDAGFLDFSAADNRIYWTNTKDMSILRSFLNGTEVEIFTDIGIEMLEGLAIDWIGRNVYWADSSTNRIEVAHMDRTSRRSIVWRDLDSPRCLALDPSNGYIYWSEWGTEPCIKRAEMDGSNVVQVVKKGITGRANSLTIDHEEQRLYWVDFDINMVISSDMNGGDQRGIIEGQGSKSISSLAIYGQFIYWSDSKHTSVERGDKITGGDRIVIESGLSDVDDILVYHASRQSGVTSCSSNNGGCEHICFSLPNGRAACSCPAHYTLNKDNTTCTAPSNFLLISQTKYISRIVFHTPAGEAAVIPGQTHSRQTRSVSPTAQPSPDAVIPVHEIKDACALDYDPIGKRLFWLDCGSGEIRSSRQNGTEMKVLLPGNTSQHQPYDFAVDPYSKLIYWTDALTNSINVMRDTGEPMGTVLTIRHYGRKRIEIMPRKIAVDSKNGYLFFSNTCKDGSSTCRFKIMRCDLDGSASITLFKINLKNVSALTVDTEEGRLYWADQSRIESSRLDGKDRKILLQEVDEPVGLAVFGDELFWVDPQVAGGLIEGADKSSGSNRRKIQSRMRNLRDIVSIIEMDESAFLYHPCLDDNGDCSHICVPREDRTTRCSCPNHLILSTDFECVEPTTCTSDQFTCKIVRHCIPASFRCDGEVECEDGSDELDCPKVNKCEGKFICGNNLRSHSDKSSLVQTILETDIPQCVLRSQVCDGEQDCVDGSDEDQCNPACNKGEKLCRSGVCVSATTGSCSEASPIAEPNGDNTIVIVICVICGCAVLLGIGLFLRHCMTHDSTHYPPGVVMFTPNSNGHLNLNVEFQPHNEFNRTRTSAIKGRKKASSFNFSIGPPGSTRGSGGSRGWPGCQSGGLAERPGIPGASSTSSTKNGPVKLYPAPTYNCGEEFLCSSDSPTIRTSSYYRCKKGHKHRKHLKPSGPPPTPCTTDACEEMEGKSCRHESNVNIPHEPPPPYYRHHSCCHHCYHQYNPRHHASSSTSTSSYPCRGEDCGKPPSYEPHRHSVRWHRYLPSDLNSDSDPYAPPPTPRSQYMSECCDTTEVEDATEVEAITARIDAFVKDDEETELLARSSPSITERSYCIYNPPPSPVTD